MWAQLISAFLGLWLMYAPSLLGARPPAAQSEELVGLLVIATALVAMGEITRFVRWIQVGLGFWLIVSTVVLEYASPAAALNDILMGCALVYCAYRKGKIIRRYGGGWSALLK